MKPGHRALLVLIAVAAAAGFTAAADPADTFPTSLHATRAGKAHWYGAATGGFEGLAGVGMAELGCAGCHGAVDADGAAYPAPFPGASCTDCHATADRSVTEARCYGCHGRQALEAKRLGLPDVHREAGMTCWDCHPSEDLHGDGERYLSMHEPGAIKADCAGCHERSSLPASHAEHDPHQGALHCTACHAASVVSCYNCHFESQVESQVKRAMKPLSGFVLLVNRAKDGTVHPASFQSVTYRGRSFVAVGPYTPHATIRAGRSCGDCHLGRGEAPNRALEQLATEGAIRLVSWNAETRELEWLRGVVPIPEGYESTLRMDFMTFEGDTATPPGHDAGPWSPLGTGTPDGWQMLFATPLTPDQMSSLGVPQQE